MDAVGRIETPVGPIVVRVEGDTVRSASFDWEDVAEAHGHSTVIASVADQLAAYFADELDQFDVPLAWPSLAPFQRAVLEETVAISYGATSTYGAIATAIGRPGEARAVGGALRTNPWVIIVPCHRVIAANGDLTGYGGGPDTGGRLDVKAILLDHERRRFQPTLF